MTIVAFQIAAQVTREANRIIDLLTDCPEQKVRCVTKVAQKLLLNAPYGANPYRFDIEAKALGTGIYEVSRKNMKS